MKRVSIIKHSLTILSLAALAVGLFDLFTLDVTSDAFGNLILSGIFFLALFLAIAVYRIQWIGRQKINWIALILFALNLLGLLLMWINPKNVMALWKPTVALFILLSTYTFYLKIDRNNLTAAIAKFSLLITACLFLSPLLIKITHPMYFVIVWLSLAATTILTIVHLFLPEKSSN